MSHETKQAEKAYLARTGSAAWEYAKPFSHPGADTLSDSAQLLHDFAVALLALRPAMDDLILDIGSGGCWCSDLLARLNRRSVAVDISVDMLRTGRLRQTAGLFHAVVGDIENLPFRAGAFTKAMCFSAIHHVPDMPAALGEIGRVLTDDGAAIFSEPGLGHSGAPVSTAAMRDFGVLEQDILIDKFTALCHQSGFVDVRLKVLSYAIPEFDLTSEQWSQWSRLASSKRPARAARKLLLAAAELLGLGKRHVLFREALGMSVVRVLRHAMENHPVIVASKRRRSVSTDPALAWRATIEIHRFEWGRSATDVAVSLTATNSGTERWVAGASAGRVVRLGVQVLDTQLRLVSRDHHRVPLPHDVAPGEKVGLSFRCPAPDSVSAGALKFDFVAEGITWFETTGSTPVIHRLEST